MVKAVLLVGTGGAIGSCLRYLIALYMQKCFPTAYPWGTFIANVAGCLIIGLIMGYFSKQQIDNTDYKLLLVTGFCGGFTTFSAFAYENFTLWQQGNNSIAFFYTILSLMIGLLAVMCGYALSKF
jgi:CrcB protein